MTDIINIVRMIDKQARQIEQAGKLGCQKL